MITIQLISDVTACTYLVLCRERDKLPLVCIYSEVNSWAS